MEHHPDDPSWPITRARRRRRTLQVLAALVVLALAVPVVASIVTVLG